VIHHSHRIDRKHETETQNRRQQAGDHEPEPWATKSLKAQGTNNKDRPTTSPKDRERLAAQEYNHSMSSEWSLCLTSSQGRKILKVSPTATCQELYTLAQASELKSGFPPKSLPNDQTPIQLLVQNQERIQLVEVAASTTNTKKTSSTKRPQRAAAKAATAAMPDVIRAQEAMMQETTTSTRKRSRTTSNRKPPPRRPMGPGRRLADGAAVAAPPRRGRAPSKPPATDMSEALLGALNHSGQMGRVLRKGLKSVVESAYDTTRAFSRLAVIASGDYQLSVRGNETLELEYRGTVDKTLVQEQVDCIPKDVLVEVVKGIHASDKEALRPENLSVLSPRVLWSMVHWCESTRDIKTMYHMLWPDLDWSFLRRRAQQLSEKARENLRQEQSDTPDMEEAAKAIAAVESAMEHLHDYDANTRKEKRAQAAVSRMQGWKLTTPNELDHDELRECVQTSMPQERIDEWIPKLVERNIHNWRELANVRDPAQLKLDLSDGEIQPWIDYAQAQSVDEIIVEICDNNVEAVELLREQARTGTPKDLALWKAIPESLCQVCNNKLPRDTVATWCERAHHTLQEFEWLQWYATPVE